SSIAEDLAAIRKARPYSGPKEWVPQLHLQYGHDMRLRANRGAVARADGATGELLVERAENFLQYVPADVRDAEEGSESLPSAKGFTGPQTEGTLTDGGDSSTGDPMGSKETPGSAEQHHPGEEANKEYQTNNNNGASAEPSKAQSSNGHLVADMDEV